jgi:hypothetical protein
MTSEAGLDALLDRLAQLPSSPADVERAQRVRERCTDVLAQRRASSRRELERRHRVAVALVGGLTVVYAAALVFDLARLYGLF